MKVAMLAAAHAFYSINRDRYELLEDYDIGEFGNEFILVKDYETNDICIIKPVQLDRPITSSDEGIISRKKFEQVIDKCLDALDDVNMFFRFDIMHIFITKQNRALIRLHVNVIPYEEKEDE